MQIEKISLNYRCTLKDASAYNIQFHNFPIFIDHGSFAPYEEGKPWIAYNQFCEHFLAPLILISHYGLQPNNISSSSIEGIKINIASKLLPLKNISTFIHIHLQNYFLKKYSKKKTFTDKKKISLKKRKLLIESLINFVENLNFKSHSSEWENYYLKNSNNYASDAFLNKKEIISKFCKEIKFSKAFDLGSNDGYFSRVIQENCDLVVSADFDHNAVNYNYVKSISKKESKLHAIYLDIVNPTPAIGWLNNERKSFFDRADFDLILGLALIHHLVITKGIPMFKVCEMFYRLTKKYAIIEVPDVKDSQVQLLSNWNTIYNNKYSLKKFEEEFSKSFEIIEKLEIKNTKRILYLLKKHY